MKAGFRVKRQRLNREKQLNRDVHPEPSNRSAALPTLLPAKPVKHVSSSVPKIRATRRLHEQSNPTQPDRIVRRLHKPPLRQDLPKQEQPIPAAMSRHSSAMQGHKPPLLHSSKTCTQESAGMQNLSRTTWKERAQQRRAAIRRQILTDQDRATNIPYLIQEPRVR